MEKLKKLVETNPKLQGGRFDYLQLAVKDDKGAVKGTGPHRVKLLGCKNATNRDYQTQKEVKGVNLLFEEDGVEKKYFVPTLGQDGKFHYLVERFAEIEEGTELILEYKRREGSFKGFIDLQVVGEEEQEKVVQDDEIPIVEDETAEEDISPELRIEEES